MAAMPGFKSQRQSSSAAPFPTPPTIGHSCQHSLFFQLYWAAIVSPGRCGPVVWSQSSPSSYTGSVTRGSWLSPSYILGGSHSHPPGSKHGLSCSAYLWNPLKVIDMLNNCSRGYLQNCCYSKQLSMALLHASHPPAQTCGGKDILCIYIFLIFHGPRVLDPIANPCLGPPWLHPVRSLL